eukprot:Skav230411  [mRNA]  locus=scaffold4006:76271:87746:+ [translate_table: standard]
MRQDKTISKRGQAKLLEVQVISELEDGMHNREHFISHEIVGLRAKCFNENALLKNLRSLSACSWMPAVPSDETGWSWSSASTIPAGFKRDQTRLSADLSTLQLFWWCSQGDSFCQCVMCQSHQVLVDLLLKYVQVPRLSFNRLDLALLLHVKDTKVPKVADGTPIPKSDHFKCRNGEKLPDCNIPCTEISSKKLDISHQQLQKGGFQELKSIPSMDLLVCWNIKESDILLGKGEDADRADPWPHEVAAVETQALDISDATSGVWRLVSKSPKERDRFVCAVKILQLYHSLQIQLSEERFSTPKQSEMEGYGQGGLLLWDAQLWLDSTLPNSPEIRKTKPRRHQAAGYRHMCRFQSSTVLELPAFQQMRYLLHLDSDATFHCQGLASMTLDRWSPFTPTTHFRGMLFEVGLEDPGCTKGWLDETKQLILMSVLIQLSGSEIACLSLTCDQLLQDTSNDTEKMVEVLDLDFFTSSDVMHFTKRVEAILGHYRYLWGDHLVLLHASWERVRCFDASELPGSHGCSAENQFDPEVAKGEDWHYIYSVVDDVSCPHLWSDVGLKSPKLRCDLSRDKHHEATKMRCDVARWSWKWDRGAEDITDGFLCWLQWLQWLAGLHQWSASDYATSSLIARHGMAMGFGKQSITSDLADKDLRILRPCEGFDFVYRDSLRDADCVLRSERADDKARRFLNSTGPQNCGQHHG